MKIPSPEWSEEVDRRMAEAAALRVAAIDLCLSEPFNADGSHSNRIEVGTLVAYSKKSLKSIHTPPTDPQWFARGYVQSMKVLGREPNQITIVVVKWLPIRGHSLVKKGGVWITGPDIPGSTFPMKTVLQNLARVGPNSAFCLGQEEVDPTYHHRQPTKGKRKGR